MRCLFAVSSRFVQRVSLTVNIDLSDVTNRYYTVLYRTVVVYEKKNQSLVFSGFRKIPTLGSTARWETRQASFPTGTVCPWVGIFLSPLNTNDHTGQCKRTGGFYNELVVAFYSTGGGVKGKKIYTCWLYYLFINLHFFYLWWHLAHRPPITWQFMALPSNWWFNSWFGLQIQYSSGVLPWQVFFSSVTA